MESFCTVDTNGDHESRMQESIQTGFLSRVLYFIHTYRAQMHPELDTEEAAEPETVARGGERQADRTPNGKAIEGNRLATVRVDQDPMRATLCTPRPERLDQHPEAFRASGTCSICLSNNVSKHSFGTQ